MTAPVSPVSQLVFGQAPPPDYYAENLGRLIAEVAARHSDLMSAKERALVAAWNALSVGSRRLLARIDTASAQSISAEVAAGISDEAGLLRVDECDSRDPSFICRALLPSQFPSRFT